MSTEEPGGTWQYPQSVCCPAGALVGSTTPGCATRQKGRSGCRPAFTSVSLRATSSKEPPTCTVPASRQAAACQGTGPLSAQSTLQTPGPYLKRSSDLRCRAESAGPASSANWRGVRSSRTVLAGGRSASDRTHCPVSSSPPREASSAVSASTSLALPPSTTGQPTACAIMMNIRPNAPVPTAVSGCMVCAAAPASRARASSVRKRFASRLAGGRPLMANLAMASGWPGSDRSGASTSGRISGACRTSGSSSRR